MSRDTGTGGETRCEKCGGTDILLRWHGKGGSAECGWFAQARFYGEHLHCTCRTCQYEWRREPLTLAVPGVTVPVSASGGPISDEREGLNARIDYLSSALTLRPSPFELEAASNLLLELRAVLTQHEEDFAWLQMALGGWEAFRPVRATNEMRDVLARIAAVLAGVRSDG